MTQAQVISDIPKPVNYAALVIKMILALALFFLAIDWLTFAVSQVNDNTAREIFSATANPFVGLFIGLLMTALIQSSSTVTSMVVAVVASGNLNFASAVPMIMGANIGTTLTSTLVSLGYVIKKDQFRKAISAGILHDFFNIFIVIILLPLEYYFQALSGSAAYIATNYFSIDQNFSGELSYGKLFTRPLTEAIMSLIPNVYLSITLSVLLLFLAIKLLSGIIYKAFIVEGFKKTSKKIFKSPLSAFSMGTLITAAVQSSTVTTSLIVPLVAAKKVSLSKVFPFIIGANVGTTITAVIASLYKSEAAVSIAIAHVLFNLFGALLFLPFPFLRNIPINLAARFGNMTTKTRFVGFAYILMTFFVIPFLLIYFNRSDQSRLQTRKKAETFWSIPKEEKDTNKSDLS